MFQAGSGNVCEGPRRFARTTDSAPIGGKKKWPGKVTQCGLNTKSLTLISRIPFKPTLLTFAIDDF